MNIITIIACLVTVTVNNKLESRLMTGDYKGETESFYLVDFSTAASGIKDLDGDYSEVLIRKTECTVKKRIVGKQ